MKPKHRVRISKGTLLYQILGKTELKVNSLHGGQVVDPGKYRLSDFKALDALYDIGYKAGKEHFDGR